MMKRLIIKFTINAFLLWLTAHYVDGMALSARWGDIIRVTVLFSLFNTLLKPLVNLLTLPLSIMTLGLFRLVVNAAMLWLVASNSPALSFSGATSEKLTALALATLAITMGGALLGRLFVDS
jgi:putative membrane protein